VARLRTVGFHILTEVGLVEQNHRLGATAGGQGQKAFDAAQLEVEIEVSDQDEDVDVGGDDLLLCHSTDYRLPATHLSQPSATRDGRLSHKATPSGQHGFHRDLGRASLSRHSDPVADNGQIDTSGYLVPETARETCLELALLTVGQVVIPLSGRDAGRQTALGLEFM